MRGKSFIALAVMALLIVSVPAFAGNIQTQVVQTEPVIGAPIPEISGQQENPEYYVLPIVEPVTEISGQQENPEYYVVPVIEPKPAPGRTIGSSLQEGSGQSLMPGTGEAPVSEPKLEPVDPIGSSLFEGSGQVLMPGIGESPVTEPKVEPVDPVGSNLVEGSGQVLMPGIGESPVTEPKFEPVDPVGSNLIEGSGQALDPSLGEAPPSEVKPEPGETIGGELPDVTGHGPGPNNEFIEVITAPNEEAPAPSEEAPAPNEEAPAPNEESNEFVGEAAPITPNPEEEPTGQNPEQAFIDPLGLENEPATATTFTLQGVYPNPFNPSTTIRFLVTASSQVNLKVFNTAGCLVATLVNNRLEAGYHEAAFSGANLPSGVYLYRLQMGNAATMGKMSLVK